MPTFMIASSRGVRVRTMPDPLVHDLIFSSVAAGLVGMEGISYQHHRIAHVLPEPTYRLPLLRALIACHYAMLMTKCGPT